MANWQSFEPCVACKSEIDGGNCFHHLLSRGANPELQDENWNKISSCVRCHDLFHKKGIVFMAYKFPSVEKWLLKNEWWLDEFYIEWKHRKI